jgi:hypothetical protein
VGIGTTAPTEKMHIHGGNVMIRSTVSDNSANVIYFSTSGLGADVASGALPVGKRFGVHILPSAEFNGAGGSYVKSADVHLKAQGLTWAGNNSPAAEIILGGGKAAPGPISLPGDIIFKTGGTTNTESDHFWGGGATRMVIAGSNGNVGIGTTNPQARLHSVGNQAILEGSTFDTLVVKRTLSDFGANAGIKLLPTQDEDISSAYIRSAMQTAAEGPYITFGFNPGGERMRIASNGNVGIGTTAPVDKLHVVGKVTETGSHVFSRHFQVTFDQTATINVPYAKSEDFRSIRMKLETVSIRANSSARRELSLEGVAYVYDIPVDFHIFNTSQFYSDNIRPVVSCKVIPTTTTTGNVEVKISANAAGTASWGIRLHLQGPLVWTSTGTVVTDSSVVVTTPLDNYGSLGMTNAFGGNVGIGTTIPSEALHVIGNILASGTITPSSDDRVKVDESHIADALPTILKLRPQVYRKLPGLEDTSGGFIESGLIAQEVYYDAPELRHLVKVPEDASGVEVPPAGYGESSDPNADPDYSNWGSTPAALNYIGLIPYLIRGMQEQEARIKNLEAQLATSSVSS